MDWIPLLPHARRHIGDDFRKFSPETNDKNEVISQKPTKNWTLGKIGHFSTLFGQKIPNFEFSHGYNYSHTH